MVGRLDALVDGRPLTIHGKGDTLRIDSLSLWTAITRRRHLRAARARLLPLLGETGLRVVLKIRGLPAVSLPLR